MDHEEEENSGYNMRMKAPGRQTKSNFEVYAEDIEEDIQSEHDHEQHTHGKDSESGRGFGITVSQSLGIDKSVDSLALDEYDHIENIEF